jgi:hypothetical protein
MTWQSTIEKASIVIDTLLRHRNIRNIDSYSFLLLGFPRCSFKIFQLLNYLQIAYFILWLCISNINNLLYGTKYVHCR